jgi:hypothetical protein
MATTVIAAPPAPAAPPPEPNAQPISSNTGTAKVEATIDKKAAPEQKAPERPAWLPEKFKTPEDFAKSYAELEAKQSGKPPEAPAAKKDETPVAGSPAPSATEAQALVEKAGLDMSKLKAEYAEKGEFTPESLEALEKAGVTKDVVNNYVAGLQAQAEAYTAKVAESVGGTEEMQKLFQWAGQNLTPDEVKSADAVLANGDPVVSALLLQGLQARYVQQNGKEPKLVTGSPAPSKGIEPFESQADMLKAMGSQEYKTNPAFRARVEQRMAATDMFRVRHG